MKYSIHLRNGVPTKDAFHDPQTVALIKGALDGLNTRLDAIERHPRVQEFRANTREPAGQLAREHSPAELVQAHAQLQHEIAQHKLHEAAPHLVAEHPHFIKKDAEEQAATRDASHTISRHGKLTFFEGKDKAKPQTDDGGAHLRALRAREVEAMKVLVHDINQHLGKI
jgi:hypothetical protein